MKAFALESADRPARTIDIPKPEAGEADVLVRVKAASVNGIDIYQAMGALAGMLQHAYPTVVGRDFAGVVEGAGPSFGGFAVGDEAFGFIPTIPPLKSGAFAEYVSGGPALVLARKPAGLGFSEAAALPLAGSAALDLLDAIDARKGDVLLIVGATGGVGSFAVQLAAQRGLKVIATALPDQEAYVRGLGAAETIDYSAGDVADAVRGRYPDGIAALIDVANQKEALTALASIVRPGGHVATLMGAADVELLASRGIGAANVMAAPTAVKLNLLAGLASSGALRVQIQAAYSIDRADEALKAFQRGTRGKVVLTF
ncbi:MAG: NADP-dependent oxidoreductase [Candidatus Limnocylindrales bacterium]|jgi:NADPH:quinone reductase-like Zn-dependent oxidoreductase